MEDLRPLAVTRAAMVLTALFLASPALSAGVAVPGSAGETATTAGALLCLYAGVRAWRYRLRIAGEHLHVRGLLWNRRIPRPAVRRVSALPAVLWRTGRLPRWTPLVPFLVDGGVLPAVQRRTEDVVDALETWAAQGQVPVPGGHQERRRPRS